MSVHLQESESTVCLQTGFNNIAKVLEQWDEICLGGVRSKVANIARCLPLRGLGDDHVIAVGAVGREVVVAEWCSWGHAHRSHSLLLRNRRLSLLVGPVAANRPRAEPFTVHRLQSFLGIFEFAECDESISSRAASLHVPHDPSFRNRTKGRESLQQHFVVDFIAQITDEDVEMIRCVLLVGVVGLVGPVYADFLNQ